MKFLPSTIINFHAVYNPQWMEDVLKLLKRNYHLVPIQDIEAYYYENRRLSNACHITFDDGDQSFYTTVFPLLKKHKIPASIYVSPKIIKGGGNFWFQEIRGYDQQRLRNIIGDFTGEEGIKPKSPVSALMKNLTIEQIWRVIREYQKQTGTPPKPGVNMTFDQLNELQKSGLVAIGAHTQNHPILKNETDETAYKEIIDSINQLSEVLQEEVRYFAYPNGTPALDFSQREINVLKEAGIRLGFSTENKTISRGDDPYSIPRKGITRGSMPFILLKLLMGKHWDSLKSITKKNSEQYFRKRNTTA